MKRFNSAFWLCLGLYLLAGRSAAQSLAFPAAASADPVALSKAMPALAGAVTAVYRDDDQGRYLDNLFRLQIVAGRDAEASASLGRLRALRARSASPRDVAKDVQYQIFLRAKAIEAAGGASFDDAFARAFREAFARLDDRTSALVARAMSQYSPGISLHIPFEETLQAALARQKGRSDITLADALDLVRAWQVAQTYRAFLPLADALIAEDDRRRYVIEEVPVRTPDAATVCATVVRQRSATRPQPTLLEFTIYADPRVTLSEARRTASNGYVGVEGLTRGKGCSPDRPVPYEHDGADAAALIDWISAQPWSDGRVGMFGASYTGFTDWAAVKHRPKALKAIMDAVTNIPGIDSPMEGGVTFSFGYYWPFYTTNNKTLDDAAFNDRARWNGLYRKWYLGGGPYRSMDKIDGVANPIRDRMLDHPAYDAYWQAMVPYRGEFALVDIPVLTTTGYYDGGQIGALYALTEHYKYNPKADHYLVIGPYDHHGGNRGTIDVLGDRAATLQGYRIDPAAQIDLGELRYQWFDFIFKGGPKPAILKDRINYEVMGENRWRHAPSIAAMSERALRLYFSASRSRDFYSLVDRTPSAATSVPLVLDLADRSDVDRVSPATGDIVDKALDSYGSVVFQSAAFERPTELSGLFSGRLAFVTNKKDFDFQIQLYELTPDRKYVSLSYYTARASYVRDRTRRQLLTPGARQSLDFTSGRLTSLVLPPGSRILVMISLIKMPGAQINYGSGKEVSDETLADAGAPMDIHWLSDSYLDLPVRRP